jgi:hypothetical protein
MGPYKEMFVRIWCESETSNPVNILKGVEQGCPFSSFSFIYIDPIFTFIKRQENEEYAYLIDEFPINLIQAYTDDVILMSNITEGL